MLWAGFVRRLETFTFKIARRRRAKHAADGLWRASKPGRICARRISINTRQIKVPLSADRRARHHLVEETG